MKGEPDVSVKEGNLPRVVRVGCLYLDGPPGVLVASLSGDHRCVFLAPPLSWFEFGFVGESIECIAETGEVIRAYDVISVVGAILSVVSLAGEPRFEGDQRVHAGVKLIGEAFFYAVSAALEAS